MKKTFSTRYLCADEGGQQVLRSSHGRVMPGTTPVFSDEMKISLVAGFPNRLKDASFFLSPTLQLNSDLGTYSEEELLILAKAELKRFQALKYRSYQVEADPRIGVLASDGEKLDTFIDTYGGILEIEPLLLNDSHPEYPTITELSFEPVKNGCQLLYRKRSPVKMQNCSYCGSCGTVCPENCISPDLFVDFNRCTFCKECEKVCAYDAMDIYGIEEVEMQVPAVIILGNTKIELPENCDSVYREEQISEFFKTVYTAEINEVVCHNNSICQYSSKLGTGCARCVDSCPHGAIQKGKNGIVINHLDCQECGTCIAVCPTGAMQNGNFEDAVLIDYLQNLGHAFAKELVVGEERQLHELWWRQGDGDVKEPFYLEYSRLGSLSVFQLLLFFVSGYQRVVLVADDAAKATSKLMQQVATANTIIESLYERSFVQILSVGDYLDEPVQTISTPILAPLHFAATDNRRAGLSQIMLHLLKDSDKVLTADQVGHVFSDITCDADNCTQCLACLNECKMQALKADQDNYSLVYESGHCVGCGICVTVCPEKVLSMGEEYSVDADFFNRRILAQAVPVKCKECGKVFGTRKSLDRVMQILSARETVNTDHFEYCSTCRVVKLFEIEGA